jgi:hypothetical protein
MQGQPPVLDRSALSATVPLDVIYQRVITNAFSALSELMQRFVLLMTTVLNGVLLTFHTPCRLPFERDPDRKEKLFAYFRRTRIQFVRLLALTLWTKHLPVLEHARVCTLMESSMFHLLTCLVDTRLFATS